MTKESQARGEIEGLSNKASKLVTAAYQTVYAYLETGGDGDFWIERGMVLFKAVAQAFCYEQQAVGNHVLKASDLLDSLSLDSVERLYLNGYQESLSHNGDWSEGYGLIRDYLDTFLPAYDVDILLTQHGFINPNNHTFKYGRKFTSVADLKQEPMAAEKHDYFRMTLMPALKHLSVRVYRNQIMANHDKKVEEKQKQRGRPPLPEGEGKIVRASLRTTQERLDRADRLSSAANLSRNEWLERLIDLAKK